jgi:hypothetical protein
MTPPGVNILALISKHIPSPSCCQPHSRVSIQCKYLSDLNGTPTRRKETKLLQPKFLPQIDLLSWAHLSSKTQPPPLLYKLFLVVGPLCRKDGWVFLQSRRGHCVMPIMARSIFRSLLRCHVGIEMDSEAGDAKHDV